MTGPVSALCERYNRVVEWTNAMAYLGKPECAVGTANKEMLPTPEVKELNRKNKDAHILGVRLSGGDYVPLLAPMSNWRGRELTAELVNSGVHPYDVWVASADFSQGDDPVWEIKNAVEWLLWTWQDQNSLNEKCATT